MAKVFVLFNHDCETKPFVFSYLPFFIRTLLISLSLRDHMKFGGWWKDQTGPTKNFQNAQSSAQGGCQVSGGAVDLQLLKSYPEIMLISVCAVSYYAWRAVGNLCSREDIPPYLRWESIWSHNWQHGVPEEDHLSLKRLTSENCFCRRSHSPGWSLGGGQGWGELLTWKVHPRVLSAGGTWFGSQLGCCLIVHLGAKKLFRDILGLSIAKAVEHFC